MWPSLYPVAPSKIWHLGALGIKTNTETHWHSNREKWVNQWEYIAAIFHIRPKLVESMQNTQFHWKFSKELEPPLTILLRMSQMRTSQDNWHRFFSYRCPSHHPINQQHEITKGHSKQHWPHPWNISYWPHPYFIHSSTAIPLRRAPAAVSSSTVLKRCCTSCHNCRYYNTYHVTPRWPRWIAHVYKTGEEVVVWVNLIQPLTLWGTQITFTSTIRKPSKRDVDVVLIPLNDVKSLCVILKPGYKTKKASVFFSRNRFIWYSVLPDLDVTIDCHCVFWRFGSWCGGSQVCLVILALCMRSSNQFICHTQTQLIVISKCQIHLCYVWRPDR